VGQGEVELIGVAGLEFKRTYDKIIIGNPAVQPSSRKGAINEY